MEKSLEKALSVKTVELIGLQDLPTIVAMAHQITIEQIHRTMIHHSILLLIQWFVTHVERLYQPIQNTAHTVAKNYM